MPTRPKTFRPRHQAKARPKRDERPSSTQRGYGYRWQKLRAAYLSEHPACVQCDRIDTGKHGQNSNHVDHVTPHKGDYELQWDWANLQTLCGACHRVKTGKGE